MMTSNLFSLITPPRSPLVFRRKLSVVKIKTRPADIVVFGLEQFEVLLFFFCELLADFNGQGVLSTTSRFLNAQSGEVRDLLLSSSSVDLEGEPCFLNEKPFLGE